MSSLEERFWLMWVPSPVPADEGRLMCQACGRWRGEKHGPDCGIRPLLDTIDELRAAMRQFAIRTVGSTSAYCAHCNSESWNFEKGEPEKHKPGCLAGALDALARHHRRSGAAGGTR